MKKTYLLLSTGILTIILLTACGNGSTTPTAAPTAAPSPIPTPTPKVTGQFVDTFVAGLKYTCSSGIIGITNVTGEYTCNVGDTVEFFLGKYKLGSATASSGIVTPEVLYPNNPDAELNVAQLLQTLDTDSTDGIITIPENYSALDNTVITPTSTDFDAEITSVIGETLVTEEEAQAHLDEEELLARFAGKTFYYVEGSGDRQQVFTVVFDANLTSFDSTENDAPVMTTLDGKHLNLPDNESLILAEVTDDYLVFNFFKNAVFSNTWRLYSEKSKADAYFELLQTQLPSLIVGWTKYYKNSKGNIGSRVYGDDGTYTGTFEGNAVSGTYSISNNILTIIRTSGGSNINIELTYLNSVDGALNFDISVNGGETFQTTSYPTEAARDAS